MQWAPDEAQNGARPDALQVFATKGGIHFIGFIQRIFNSEHQGLLKTCTNRSAGRRMKNRIIFLLSVLSALFVPAAYGGNDAAAIASAQAGAQIDAPQRGTLYRVRHADSTVYLFGTIHVGLPSFFPLEPVVTRALEQSRTLVVELDVRKTLPFQAALQKHGLYAEGDRIDRHLSQPDMMRVQQALQRFDIPFEQAARMKPWLLANLLVGLNLERHGYQRSQGIEYFLLAFADKQKMRVQELESADYQMALFDGMSDEKQAQYLRENLAELDDGQADSKNAALIDAWAHANSPAIENVIRASLSEKTESAEFTRRILLDERNPNMAQKVTGLLKVPGSSFVAVGLLHLVGARGVPSLLTQKGYVVEKLY
jgi:uncharacterized protein